MFKSLVSVISLSLATSSLALANNSDDMVKNADQYRLSNDASKVVSHVSLYENGELDKTRDYHVYTRADRQSLVVFKSKVEAGQKMLMLGDNYWLVMPKSRRPIRITPMQKLLGEASVGDISTLTWSEDYQSELISTEDIVVSGESTSSNLLKLTAKTKSASYQTIDLWLDANNDFPLQADLYLRSGKLAKRAEFTQGQNNGVLSVTEMTLFDKIQPSKKTVIQYQSIEATEIDDKYYNPSYLTRNSISEL